VDDFRVPYPVWSQWDNDSGESPPSNRGGYRGERIVLTERGYLLVVKPMRDPLAWAIHKMLVNLYFAVKERRQQAFELPAGIKENRNHFMRSGRHGPQTGEATAQKIGDTFRPRRANELCSPTRPTIDGWRREAR
jgi:hypothetical protein